MAGAMRKTMIYLGLADGDEHYESELSTQQKDEDNSMEHDREERRAPAPLREVTREVPPAAEEEYRAPVTPIKRAASSREDARASRVTGSTSSTRVVNRIVAPSVSQERT